jgi:glutamyl-tRNA(Gln) amidotransferase subunit E
MADSDVERPGGVRPPPELNPRTEPVLDFREKPLRDMDSGDYDAIGFLAGLEVHQQLLTESKLFCRCPAGRTATVVDGRALRHMRPTLSELGEYDRTALMEFKTRKEVVYLLDRTTVCTYELDDTPPFEIDPAAVGIAVELAALCDLNLVSELHVMRKQYLDGSIPTGFQRTAMVGLTGDVPLRVPELGVDRRLRIRQLSLEEDSCREVSDVGHRITFRTDRLGMPLTEVVTEPDLLTPWELEAGARLLAEIARATGKVRRGPGAARQDVNVSVAGGRRVEIKGVPRHRGLPLLVHTEAFRQLELLRIRDELRRRGVEAGMLPDPPAGPPWETSGLAVDASGTLRGSSHEPLRAALAAGDTAVAVRLRGYAGLLSHRTQPGLTFGHELAERVRVIACPARPTFLAHSDDGDVGLGAGEWRELRAALGAESDDAIVVVWTPRADAATAAREILIRAREGLEGVPAETRQAWADGRTGFERLLPGPDRMYPDTDTPPLPIDDGLVAAIHARLPERPWEREARYEALGLDPGPARRLARAPWAPLFDAAAPEAGGVARRLAAVLEKRAPHHERRGAIGLTAERVSPLVRALESGRLLPSGLRNALDAVADGSRSPADVLGDHVPVPPDSGALAARVEEVVVASVALEGRPPEVVLRWAMGEVMRALRGRVDPVAVRQRLETALRSRAAGATA